MAWWGFVQGGFKKIDRAAGPGLLGFRDVAPPKGADQFRLIVDRNQSANVSLATAAKGTVAGGVRTSKMLAGVSKSVAERDRRSGANLLWMVLMREPGMVSRRKTWSLLLELLS